MKGDPGLVLDAQVGANSPGLQYQVRNANELLFEYSGGFADIRHQRPMDAFTTLNAYSMSKTFTAAAVLRLAQAGGLKLDDTIARYFAQLPYDRSITIRHLLTHTAGIPNPIPLRWVHLVQRHCDFDEAVALKQVLLRNPKLSAVPGTRYIYSNIGYWLLGGIIAIAAAQPFEDFVREQVLQPLGIAPRDVSFTIPDACQHAIGYLEKYSLLNFMKGLLAERDLFGTYEGHWLRIEPHYVNGPAFGGLIGSARGFEIFLQDQLKPQSALFDEPTRRLFYEQQKTRSGQFVKMTLGWHIGKLGSRKYFFKEGGGGGFHCTMRLYADAGIASIVMSNATGFNSNACLDLLDANFL